jgi:hypothetical protein
MTTGPSLVVFCLFRSKFYTGNLVITHHIQSNRRMPVRNYLSSFAAVASKLLKRRHHWYCRANYRSMSGSMGKPSLDDTYLPFAWPFRPAFSRRRLTESARSCKTDTVSCQPMQASVMLTPYFRPALPSFGTFWLPLSGSSE